MNVKKSIISLGVFIILIAISLIGLSLGARNSSKIKMSAEQVHSMIVAGENSYDPEQMEYDIKSKVNGLTIIDLRSPDRYLIDHIKGAINIPFQRIMDEQYTRYFESKDTKIIYAEDETKSAEVWVLLTQLGYNNIYFLRGGFHYWSAKIYKKDILGNTSKFSEKARYDFKKELSPDSIQ